MNTVFKPKYSVRVTHHISLCLVLHCDHTNEDLFTLHPEGIINVINLLVLCVFLISKQCLCRLQTRDSNGIYLLVTGHLFIYKVFPN